MKKSVLSLPLAALLALALAVPASAAGGFADVDPGAYYAEAVAWAVEEGITSGTSAHTFSPDQTCTRGEIITFLWRAAGSPPISSDDYQSPPVQGISPDDFFYYPVIWAWNEGAFEGDTFRPNDPCTRLAAVEFLRRCCHFPYSENDRAPEAGFSDVASEAVDWAVARGITGGTGGDTFSPDQTCTRGQIVTMLYRDAAFDPLGSYVHESGNYRLELFRPGKGFALYLTQAYLDDPAIPYEYKPLSIASPLVEGTLSGSSYGWYWYDFSLTFYQDCAIADITGTYAEYPGISGKYIRQSP